MTKLARCTVTLLVLAVEHASSFSVTGGLHKSRRSSPLKSTEEDNQIESKKTTTSTITSVDFDWETIGQQLVDEAREISSCASLATKSFFQPDASVEAEGIVLLCDELDALVRNEDLLVSRELDLRRRALEFKRYELLAKLMRKDYKAYIATASFLSPSRIPRDQLPNVQDVPIDKNAILPSAPVGEDGVPLVADCELEAMVYKDSPLDKLLLTIFRKLVVKNTDGVTSEKEGILGLLEQGRTFMLQPGQTPEAQHKMVYDTLGGLMTPVLPPFYRIFMSGIVPKLGTDFDGKQVGPWFYAPWLTSFVTPTFFGFLVGPSKPNRRKDGQLGGLVVEKCKFLQESGCKGLCLHQCKLPAQEFFAQELGLPLTVSPNFETQECQWSFGETPVPPAEDPSFPKGCLVGCGSRKEVVGTYTDLCN
jgi:beta-carotene isomerase